jgi:ATP-dependent RNA helicase DeaD
MESEALAPDPHDLPTTFPTTDDDPASSAERLAETDPPPPPEIVTRSEDAPTVAFADFKLIRPLFDAVEKAGYKFATPVQGAVIPPAMRGQDVIGQAQTGTGKTAAFLIPFLNRWRPHNLKGPIGLVMCPTRELAVQVANEAVKLATSSRFHVVPVYGGARMGAQLTSLAKGCDLVVGTPGRIIDHLRRGSLSLEQVKYVVLDEADRMLDIGFRPDIERILRRCPESRQTLLMSATVPDSIKKLVHRYMRNPIHLNMSPTVLTVDKIQQKYITVDEEKKFDLLKLVVAREKPRQCLIFVERKRWADRLYRNLKHAVAGVAVIHGDLPQSQREKITAAFRAGKVKYLIATDVMSRGIDVEGISHVVNYDLPMDIENYVHRIGRTGRIGRDGVAISFVTPEQGGHLTDIEMIINKLIDRDEIPGFESYTRRERPDDRVRVISVDGAVTEETELDEAPVSTKKTVYGKSGRRYSQRL